MTITSEGKDIEIWTDIISNLISSTLVFIGLIIVFATQKLVSSVIPITILFVAMFLLFNSLNDNARALKMKHIRNDLGNKTTALPLSYNEREARSERSADITYRLGYTLFIIGLLLTFYCLSNNVIVVTILAVCVWAIFIGNNLYIYRSLRIKNALIWLLMEAATIVGIIIYHYNLIQI